MNFISNNQDTSSPKPWGPHATAQSSSHLMRPRSSCGTCHLLQSWVCVQTFQLLALWSLSAARGWLLALHWSCGWMSHPIPTQGRKASQASALRRPASFSQPFDQEPLAFVWSLLQLLNLQALHLLSLSAPQSTGAAHELVQVLPRRTHSIEFSPCHLHERVECLSKHRHESRTSFTKLIPQGLHLQNHESNRSPIMTQYHLPECVDWFYKLNAPRLPLQMHAQEHSSTSKIVIRLSSRTTNARLVASQNQSLGCSCLWMFKVLMISRPIINMSFYESKIIKVSVSAVSNVLLWYLEII